MWTDCPLMDSFSAKHLESKHSVSDRTTVKIQSLLTDDKEEIILQWIPAHHDITGNTLADAAVKTASQISYKWVGEYPCCVTIS